MPGVNPRWNETWAISQPDHHGAPPTGHYLGFGEPGPAIGQIVCVTSDYYASRPQPSWSSQLGRRLGAAGAVGFLSVPVLWILYAFAGPMVLRTGGPDVRENLENLSRLSSLQPLVFVFSAVLAVATFVVASARLERTPVGPTFTCRILGTEGFSEHVRTPTEDRSTVVPFAGVIIRSTKETEQHVFRHAGMKRTTFVVTHVSEWYLENGTCLYRLRWRGNAGAEPPVWGFVWAAERAQRRHRVAAQLPLLEGPGIRMVMPPSSDQIVVRRQRVDFSIGGRQFSLAPTQITRVADFGGALHLSYQGGSLVLRHDQLLDWDLLHAALLRAGATPAPAR